MVAQQVIGACASLCLARVRDWFSHESHMEGIACFCTAKMRFLTMMESRWRYWAQFKEFGGNNSVWPSYLCIEQVYSVKYYIANLVEGDMASSSPFPTMMGIIRPWWKCRWYGSNSWSLVVIIACGLPIYIWNKTIVLNLDSESCGRRCSLIFVFRQHQKIAFFDDDST